MLDISTRTEELRKRIIKTAWNGKAGHITSALSMADIIAVLFFGGILQHNPEKADWEDRDRFILSKAHGGLGLYVVLAMEGYISMDALDHYCKAGQHLGDHSNMSVNGVENSGGSLGHGLGIAAGKALSAKMKNMDYITYVLTGDGECQEGSIWESALFIGNKQLNNLVWIIDYNRLQAGSRIDNTSGLEPLSDKLKSFGFTVKIVDGHNHIDLYHALKIDRKCLPEQPTAIIANTKKGYGIPLLEDEEDWHGRLPKEKEYDMIIHGLGMTMEEFEQL